MKVNVWQPPVKAHREGDIVRIRMDIVATGYDRTLFDLAKQGKTLIIDEIFPAMNRMSGDRLVRLRETSTKPVCILGTRLTENPYYAMTGWLVPVKREEK